MNCAKRATIQTQRKKEVVLSVLLKEQGSEHYYGWLSMESYISLNNDVIIMMFR